MASKLSFTGFAWKNLWRTATEDAADAGRHRDGHRRLCGAGGLFTLL